MPPKGKHKNPPNQQHNSGLAAPGKRVAKKTSNGHLNGAPNGKTVPAPALPSTGLNSGFKFPRPVADEPEPAVSTAAKDHAVPLEHRERDRVYSDASLEEGGHCDQVGDSNMEPATPASPTVEVPPSTSMPPAARNGNGRLASISTILSYYPLRDAISILILLLSLPPTLVLVIQTLFASLTFVPPTASISLSTLPNVKEMFNSSNFGGPALATILFVDMMFWLVWAMVWKPVQNIFVDMSQAVIAVSLSGAAASTTGPTYSIASTTVIVCAVHVLRYRAIHLTALDYLRSVIHKWDIGLQFDVPSLATNILSPPALERSSFAATCRIILGIHIVSQGVTTCIRRSLVKANEQSANAPSTAKSEPEAIAGPESNVRSGTGLAEPSQPATSAVSPEGRPAGPSPSYSDLKVRETTGKKKRKQANQVRSQQPLWAAIASTKVTFAKEMEQRVSADDAREAEKMDTTTHTSISNTTRTNDRIWICEVRDTEIIFSIELSDIATGQTVETLEEGRGVSAGIDKSKPFFIRINGAAWSSTRINPTSAEGDASGQNGDRFAGEIFGLAPLSSYKCEVVSIASQDILCSASIITQPAPATEQATSSSQPQHQALRPSSPITTLKQSIVSAEAKLRDTQNRSRKTKKDLRNAQSEIRKEVNSLKGKLESSGGADDKLERRIAQITHHKNQAEEAAADIKKEVDALGDLPADDLAHSEAARRRWQSASNAKNAANKDFDNARTEGDRELNAIRGEYTQMRTRHEKALTRLQQRSEELERLKAKQQAETSAKSKRDLERTQRQQQRENEMKAYEFHLTSMENDMQGLNQKMSAAYMEISALQTFQGQPPPYPGYSPSETPEHTQAGASNGGLASPQTGVFMPYGGLPFNPSFHTPQNSMSQPHAPPQQTRGRSSSMLSAFSSFTDGADDSLLPPEHRPQPYNWNSQPSFPTGGAAQLLDADRKESDGSGNSGSLNGGSTGSNSPRPEAKVFVPGGKPAAPLSPIGPPNGGKGKEKAPQSPLQNHANAGYDYGPVR